MNARVPPNDMPTEATILGCAMLDAECVEIAADIVAPSDFYSDSHGRIWEAILGLVAQGQPVDLTTVRSWLVSAGQLQRIGDDLLLALTDTIPNVNHIEGYARRVQELASVRRVIHVLHEQAAKGYGPMTDVRVFLDEAEAAIATVTQARAGSDDLVSMETVVQTVFEGIVSMGERGTSMVGHETGLRDLDDFLKGMCPGDLIIVGGRPGMGKTALAINNIACGIANPKIGEGSLPVIVFSCEMPKEQLVQRTISSDSGVDLTKIRSATISRDEWPQLTASAGALAELPIYFHPVTSADAITVRRQSRRARRQYGQLGCVVVDYLQLMGTRSNGDSRDAQLGEITRGLKQLALELEVPVVLLSQLNRDCEKQNDKRPRISHLRECGSIEQDADVILFVYRDEEYDKESPDRGTAEILVRKARSGPTGMVRLSFNGARTTFGDFDGHHSEEQRYGNSNGNGSSDWHDEYS